MFWDMIDDFVYITLFFAIAILLKKYVPGLKRFIIPNSILAGFVGLILGPNILGLIPLNADGLGTIIYHLMAIGFIALSLRSVKKSKNVNALNAGIIIVSTYLFQGVLGLVMLFGFNIFDKQVFPGMGLLFPLGFGQGPGQAFSIGTQWEKLGLLNGGGAGLAIAASGFGWATIGGIIILNILVVNKRKKHEQIKVVPKKEMMVKDYEFSDMDGMTIQFVIIGVIYFVVFLIIQGLKLLLSDMGDLGATLATTLEGFHFVIGAIVALLFRKGYDKLFDLGIAEENYLNDFLLHRISGLVFDFMVAASIAAVMFSEINGIIFYIILTSFIIGLGTYGFIYFIVKKTIKTHEIENRIGFFGMLTGTISTGMSLLREVDPALKSGTAENLIYGSGMSLLLGAPLLAILTFPALALKSGNSMLNAYALFSLFGYGILLWILRLVNNRKRNK
jgi:ESS family glutamate:Na+ symporter